MRQTTICFFIKDDSILLAMKKRGHGVNKWNGVGGKAEPGETIEQTAIREAQEEIGLTPRKLKKVAKITFIFPPERDFDHESTAFLCEEWDGEPAETEEMKPQWFAIKDIPYEYMWDSDTRWLPKILQGKLIVASVRSTASNGMAKYDEREVASLD